MASTADVERNLAVFVDFENLALGFTKGQSADFEMSYVLDRLLEKGKVLAKYAYADWSRFRKYTDQLHESGVGLIEIPKRGIGGKNSADIRLVVDAMELCHTKEHINTFVVVSGDSDFTPLVSKLKENGKHVIGVGMRASTSELLSENCDEFLFYEDLLPVAAPVSSGGRSMPSDQKDGWRLLLDTVRALQREDAGVIHASLLKDTMRRKRPSFTESSYGYESFGDLLEAVRDAGFIELREDERSGTWVVTGLVANKRRGSRGGKKRRSKKS